MRDNKEGKDKKEFIGKCNRASEIVKAHNEGIMEGIDMMQKLGTKKQGKQEENKESRIKAEEECMGKEKEKHKRELEEKLEELEEGIE